MWPNLAGVGTIPLTVEDIDSLWLTAALRRSGHLSSGETANIVNVQPLSGGTAYSTKMYRMRLAGPRLPVTAILKLSLTGPVRQIIDGTGAYIREVSFYRDLATDITVRIPHAYVAESDSQTGDMVLLIEDLAPLAPVDQLAGLTLAQAQAAMDGLARFHAWSWKHPRLEQFADRIPAMDSPKGRSVLEQCGQFVTMSWQAACQAAGASMSDEVKEFGNRLPALMPFFIEKLATPKTIAHGELRADNLFFDTDGTLILIDFQIAVQAAGISDVAYLLSQSLPAEVRQGQDERLVRRYWNGLISAGVSSADYPWEHAWQQYRLAVAYNLYLPGIAFMAYETANHRGKSLLLKMLSRASAAIGDNQSLALLPKES